MLRRQYQRQKSSLKASYSLIPAMDPMSSPIYLFYGMLSTYGRQGGVFHLIDIDMNRYLLSIGP